MAGSIFDSNDPLDRTIVACSYATWTFPMLWLADRLAVLVTELLFEADEEVRP